MNLKQACTELALNLQRAYTSIHLEPCGKLTGVSLKLELAYNESLHKQKASSSLKEALITSLFTAMVR